MGVGEPQANEEGDRFAMQKSRFTEKVIALP